MKRIAIRTIQLAAAVTMAWAPLAASAKSANELRDLVGARASGGDSDLESRGWTRQCLQMITADGRADSINDIQTHPRCR